ncbi:unnamed protein product [Choristocarpus tenellus]
MKQGRVYCRVLKKHHTAPDFNDHEQKSWQAPDGFWEWLKVWRNPQTSIANGESSNTLTLLPSPAATEGVSLTSPILDTLSLHQPTVPIGNGDGKALLAPWKSTPVSPPLPTAPAMPVAPSHNSEEHSDTTEIFPGADDKVTMPGTQDKSQTATTTKTTTTVATTSAKAQVNRWASLCIAPLPPLPPLPSQEQSISAQPKSQSLCQTQQGSKKVHDIEEMKVEAFTPVLPPLASVPAVPGITAETVDERIGTRAVARARAGTANEVVASREERKRSTRREVVPMGLSQGSFQSNYSGVLGRWQGDPSSCTAVASTSCSGDEELSGTGELVEGKGSKGQTTSSGKVKRQQKRGELLAEAVAICKAEVKAVDHMVMEEDEALPQVERTLCCNDTNLQTGEVHVQDSRCTNEKPSPALMERRLRSRSAQGEVHRSEGLTDWEAFSSSASAVVTSCSPTSSNTVTAAAACSANTSWTSFPRPERVLHKRNGESRIGTAAGRESAMAVATVRRRSMRDERYAVRAGEKKRKVDWPEHSTPTKDTIKCGVECISDNQSTKGVVICQVDSKRCGGQQTKQFCPRGPNLISSNVLTRRSSMRSTASTFCMITRGKMGNQYKQSCAPSGGKTEVPRGAKQCQSDHKGQQYPRRGLRSRRAKMEEKEQGCRGTRQIEVKPLLSGQRRSPRSNSGKSHNHLLDSLHH